MINRDGMMARDWQRALYIPLTILAWLAVLVVTGWLLGHVVKTILTLVFSGILAFALTPLVSFLSRFMPRFLAILLAYVLGFAIIIGAGALLVVTAADQVRHLVDNLPQYSTDLKTLKPHIVSILKPFGVNNQNYDQTQKQLLKALQSFGTTAASQSLDIITGILGTLVNIILVLILSVYLTANGQKISAWLRQQTPSPQRQNTMLLLGIINQVVGGYIRGTITLATLIGLLVGGGMWALGVPYPALLGILAFFMEFIPVVGVLVSGVVCVGVGLFTKGLILALIVLGYFVIVHVIEGDVVGPRIIGRAVGIHPATALIAFVAGTELFGIWGALLGSPIAGLLQAVGTAAYRELRGKDPTTVLKSVGEEAKEAAKEAADEATDTKAPPRDSVDGHDIPGRRPPEPGPIGSPSE